MTDSPLYEERVSSGRTTLLFAGLSLLFLSLLLWRMSAAGADALSIVFLSLSAFFLFYLLNYRTLIVRISPEDLRLRFGIFAWRIPRDNVQDARLDDLPVLLKYGGAGIHLMFVRGRYRASSNFLEHPRVVIALSKRMGPVREVSFSTRRPHEVIRLLGGGASTLAADHAGR